MDRTCGSKSIESSPEGIDPNMDDHEENVCDVCKNLDLNHFDVEAVNFSNWDSIETAYHRELPRNLCILNILRAKLLRSIEDGCASCKIIDQARRAIVPKPLDLYHTYISIYKFHDDEPLRFTLSDKKLTADSIVSRITSTYYISGIIYSPPNYIGPMPYPCIGKLRHIHKDTLSEEVLGLANSWYSSCHSAHPECLSGTAYVLPQRVIWVGPNNNAVRLVDSKGEIGRYATLSYYWTEGELPYDEDILKTFKQGIPFDELPRTFQDAIEVARALSIPYLWIDILCMVQRMDKDWSRKSNQMQDIFGNAELNISADDCSTTAIGLSCPRRAFATGNEIVTGIYARRALGPLDPFGLSHIEDGYTHDLWQRAWSLQERMLSRRILHFTAYELSWECDKSVRCECSHECRKAGQRDIREFIKDSDPGQKRKLPEMNGVPDKTNGHESSQVSSKDSSEGDLLETSNLAIDSNVCNPFQTSSQDSGKGELLETSSVAIESHGSNRFRTLSKRALLQVFRKDSSKGKLPKTSDASYQGKGLNILRRLSRDCSKDPNKDDLPEASDKDRMLEASDAPSVRDGLADSESFQLWAAICSTYTELSTYPKHPLNSIAGLAFRFGERASKTYVAGLWKEDLPWSLLWVSLGLVKRRRPDFPTWSWASVLGQVAIMKYRGHPLQENELVASFTDTWLQVKEISCVNQYTIDFPDLDSRSMKVIGWMSKIKLESDDPESEFRNGWGNCLACPPAYGCPRFNSPHADFDVAGQFNDPHCFLLFVAMLDAMYFLILRKVKDGSDKNSLAYYERIGWAKIGIRVYEFEKVMEFLKLEFAEFMLV